MGIDALPAEVVTESCQEGGVEIRDLERLRPLVYRGKLAGRREVVYVKLYEPERGEAVETVVEIGPEIGLPESIVVRTDRFVALVSEEATGRPLSHVLPIALLPGVWSIERADLISAYRRLGEYLSTLHASRETKDGPLLDERDFEKAIVAGERTAELLGSRASRRYDRLVRRARDLEGERAIVHSDPSPHNLYYEDGVIELIDVACKDAPLVRDRVAVDLGIELMVARLPYGRRSQVEQLTYSYRCGYGRRATESDAYDLQRLVKLVRLLAYYADGPTTPNAKLTKWTDVPILRDRILQSLEGTDGKTGRRSGRMATTTT